MSSTQNEWASRPPEPVTPPQLPCPVCFNGMVILDEDQAQDGWVSCAGCRAWLRLDQATLAADYAYQADCAIAYANQARENADNWQRASAEAHRQVALSAQQAQIPDPNQAVQPSTTPAASRNGARPGVPTALLLQGVGAVMILAAIVLVSAVAWTVLPPVGQAALLVAMVGVLGGLTVYTRVRIPTTSTILAVLTAAGYGVVAAGLPILLPIFDNRFYPSAAAALAALAMLSIGRLARVTVWRHLGIAVLPLVGLLLIVGILGAVPESPRAWTLAVLLLAIQSFALLAVADAQNHSDAETAATSFWSAVVLTVATGLATITALTYYLVDASGSGLADRLWVVGATLAFAVVVRAAASTWLRTGWRSLPGMALWWLPLVLVAIAVLVTPLVVNSPQIAIIPAVTLLAELAVAGVLERRSERRERPWQFAITILVAAPITAVGWVLLTDLAILGTGDWQWLTYLLLAQVIGIGLIITGDLFKSLPWSVLGWLLATGSWALAWSADHVGTEWETLTFPIAAMTLVSGSFIQHRFPDLSRSVLWRPIVLLVAVIPTFLAAWLDFYESGSFAWVRLGITAVVLGLGFALGLASRGNRTLLVGAASAGAIMYGETALIRASVELVEPFTLLLGAGVLLTLTSAYLEHLHPWRYLGLWSGAGLLVLPTFLVSLSDPLFEYPFAVARGLALLIVSAILTVWAWVRIKWLAALAGSAGLALTCWWYGWWLASSSLAEVPEVWSLPLAAGATVVIWLWLRTLTSDSVELRRWLLLAPAAVALLISTIATLAQPVAEPVAEDTVRVVLILIVWWGLLPLTRRIPKVAVPVAFIAVGLTWYQVAAFIDQQYPESGLEAYTWSAALGVGAATALALKVRPSHLNTMVTLAPATLLLLVPTAILAWAGGTLDWRGWLVLTMGGVLLIAGVHNRWAGIVYPTILAIGLIVVPVLTKLSQDLPIWVPLAIVGVVLLLAGARLESTRRSGRAVTHWAASLR